MHARHALQQPRAVRTPLSCDITSVGRVCCGETGNACAFSDGRDCCRNLLCINGRCGL